MGLRTVHTRCATHACDKVTLSLALFLSTSISRLRLVLQEGGSDPRAQLQALLQEEVAAEAERERLVAQVADPAERRQLMKAFMAEREQAKQAIMALAQGLGMG